MEREGWSVCVGKRAKIQQEEIRREKGREKTPARIVKEEEHKKLYKKIH